MTWMNEWFKIQEKYYWVRKKKRSYLAHQKCAIHSGLTNKLWSRVFDRNYPQDVYENTNVLLTRPCRKERESRAARPGSPWTQTDFLQECAAYDHIQPFCRTQRNILQTAPAPHFAQGLGINKENCTSANKQCTFNKYWLLKKWKCFTEHLAGLCH